MKPILYPSNEMDFDSNGIGILSDEIDTTVIEILNGQYELEMKYPVTGIHFQEIRSRSIILAKPDPVKDAQPFRVYRITKPMSGTVMVYARHIAYDMMGIPVAPFSMMYAATCLETIRSKAAIECPFTFWTDYNASGVMNVKVPTPMWTLLGNSEGSVLNVFGGEYDFDRYAVRLYAQRGEDRGVSIRYGKNLTSLEQDENCANCHTGVYPYWTNSEGKLVALPEKVVEASGTYDFKNIIPLDLSDEWEEAPTEAQLRTRAKTYINQNEIGTPAVSWKVEFVQLEQTEEYKGKALLERVLLGDTVSVEFAEMGVSATARAVEVRYKPVLERYESVTLGSVRANMADTIAQQQKQLKEKPNRSQMQIAIETLTSAILGATGGSVRFLDNNGDSQPDTLYIADDPDPAKAVKVWRFNYEGWGASKNGYNGPFIIGASFDSGILAEFITAGTLYGMLIKAGAIESEDGKVIINLSGSGNIPVFNTGISTNGLIVRADYAGAPRLFEVNAFSNAEVTGEANSFIFDMNAWSNTGVQIFHLGENADGKGIQMYLRSRDSSDPFPQFFSDNTGGGIIIFPALGEVESGWLLHNKASNKSEIFVDKIRPGFNAEFKWEYISSLGKTVLTKV